MRAIDYGMMTEVDDCLGRVFARLDETDQWENTLIVFTSDHGEQLGDHHLLGKIGCHDESFRIPLVIKDPNAPERRGQIEDAFTESVDLMPTLIDWIGGEVPRTCDGRSLLPLLHGNCPTNWRTELHYEFDFRDVFATRPEAALALTMDQSTLGVVQDADFKYVHFTAFRRCCSTLRPIHTNSPTSPNIQNT
jgi:arylsulfatase A-like enzyme